MLTVVIIGFGAAALIPLLRRLAGDRSTIMAALIPLAITAWAVVHFPAVVANEPLIERVAWVPELGLELGFRLDGLALLFVLMIGGIGTLVVFYTHGYLHGHPDRHRFVMFTLMFMASMLGVVVSDNILLLFVFWELTSFTSYLLIGFHHREEASRKAALQALLVTGLGGLFLLAGLILLAQAADSYLLSDLVQRGPAITGHAMYPVILGLVLIGACTKSAQVPFHFWLPNAMQAPTPASAYLHSSTMVKVGVYLLARLQPALGGTEAWFYTVTGIGALTMITGALMATSQVYLKRLLAYSTVAALGGMIMLIGTGSAASAQAVALFMLAHALYKASLFLVAGAIDHGTGEKNIAKLGGLFAGMPVTAIAAGVAALSMAGIPATLGFISKEILYAALAHPLILSVTVFAGACFMLVAFQVGIRPFWSRRQETPKHPHEAPWTMLAGPVLLGLVTLASGLFPGGFASELAGAAASSIAGARIDMHLYLWHGFNRELTLSLITLGAGAVVIVLAHQLVQAGTRAARLADIGPDRAYQAALNGLLHLAAGQTRFLQNGSLKRYLVIVVLTLCACFAVNFIRIGLVLPATGPTPLTLPVLLLGLTIMFAAVAAVFSQSRLGAVAAMGVVGFGVAIVFIYFGAPDLAMTQLVVETLSVVLLVAAFYYLPPFKKRSNRKSRRNDAVVAALTGLVMMMLVLLATGVQVADPVSDYYAQTSVPLGHGRNIVNVILVDYRALDTLGEITVLALAGIGSLALLKLRSRREDAP